MGESFAWAKPAVGLRGQLPPDVVAMIDGVGSELALDADVEAVVAALHARGLGFLYCIVGVMAISGVSLGDAKWLVHGSGSLAESRADREAGWAAMYEEVLTMPEVTQQARPPA
ncbi:hypothetical protein [Catellatospora citrea]|uniref:Uncharacterized protein n=1 Tax=Catellatospora citrea TaxID=53366 RepID=A0A8J3P178_9ACTN|nr:hypothetical protein [Catellatospora citrea]GIG00259.1 hypothetical protein Cci01nite_53520 [Catellatospora citrea]